MAEVRIRFVALGRVQGVGFRAFVRERAQELALAGWVRNAPDGSVEGEVEGEPHQLELFREALAQGPSFSRVLRLDWMPVHGSQSLPHPFEIRR